MKKTFLLSAAALLCASLAWGQETSTPQPGDQTQTTGASSTSGSIQGCLSGSDGNYLLTQDNTGATFKLSGSEDQLKAHVGHEIQVSGQMMAAGMSGQDQATSTNPGGTSTGNTSFQVSDVKMVSDQCNSGTTQSNAAPSTTASDKESAAAMSTTSGEQNAEVADGGNTTGGVNGTDTANQNSTVASSASPSNTTTAMNTEPASPAAQEQAAPAAASTNSTPSNSMPSDQTSNSATTSDPAARGGNANKLPQTGSNLPLLGVLGIGFLAAGLASAKRRNKREQSILG